MMKGSSNSNKETDDNNDVVRELDVYLTNKIDLFLLQLPLKPCYVDPPEVVSARYKPENRLLELQGDSSIPYLHSSKLSNKKSNLAVGVIKNNEMHITSIQDVFQLRPSFQHLQQDNELESFIDIDEDEPVKTEDENSFKTKANPTNKPLLQTVRFRFDFKLLYVQY